jgi:hypothetical protein
VIQGYLSGKTRGSISRELGISAGGVSNTIKEWKMRIGVPESGALRDFATTVKESGLSIEQCAQGYRMVQLMKGLEIDNDDCDEADADGYITGSNINSSGIGIGLGLGLGSDIDIKGKKMDFPIFVKEIYSNCKNLGIPPAKISSWIKDMLDFYSSHYSDSKRDSSAEIQIPFISQISFHID